MNLSCRGWLLLGHPAHLIGHWCSYCAALLEATWYWAYYARRALKRRGFQIAVAKPRSRPRRL